LYFFIANFNSQKHENTLHHVHERREAEQQPLQRLEGRRRQLQVLGEEAQSLADVLQHQSGEQQRVGHAGLSGGRLFQAIELRQHAPAACQHRDGRHRHAGRAQQQRSHLLGRQTHHLAEELRSGLAPQTLK